MLEFRVASFRIIEKGGQSFVGNAYYAFRCNFDNTKNKKTATDSRFARNG